MVLAHHGTLMLSECKMESETDRQTGAASAVLQVLY